MTAPPAAATVSIIRVARCCRGRRCTRSAMMIRCRSVS
jgi:hypothetical protein